MQAFTHSDPFGWLKNRCREIYFLFAEGLVSVNENDVGI
jgi:hypothetical protein